MSVEIFVTIASGAVATILAAVIELGFKKFKKGGKQTLDDRISKLTSALKSSSKLISEVESEIESRHKLVQELQKDAEKYENLVSMNKEQVDAVAQLLQGELRKEGNASFWKGLAANFVFFVLGAGVSWYLSANF